MGRHRRLDQSLTLATHPLPADVAFNLEHIGDVVQFLAHILADPFELAATVALSLFGLVSDSRRGKAIGSATRRGCAFGLGTIS
jgi:hypothetical protein